MIYETIPAHYFDHTDLLKAIIASKVLSENANLYAYSAAEALMEKNMTSGQAFDMGNMINILKNIECAVDYWGEIFFDVAKNKVFSGSYKLQRVISYKELQDYRDEYERRMGTELDNDSLMIPDVFHDFYDEWREQIVHPVARKYNIEYSSQQEQDFRKCGIA